MIFERLARFAGVALFAMTTVVSAQTGTERLFDSSSFDDVRGGTTLTYSHLRSAEEKVPVRAIADGSITVLRDGDSPDAAKTIVTLRQGEGRRQLEHLPADRGNPIFIVFLESSVSAITHATKGSPFYIRNRIKDAFASGGDVSEGMIDFGESQVEATHIDYRPFKGDRNAAKLGAAFENLSIQFTISEDVPGHFVAMTTQAKVDDVVYFIEEIRFDAESKGEEE